MHMEAYKAGKAREFELVVARPVGGADRELVAAEAGHAKPCITGLVLVLLIQVFQETMIAVKSFHGVLVAKRLRDDSGGIGGVLFTSLQMNESLMASTVMLTRARLLLLLRKGHCNIQHVVNGGRETALGPHRQDQLQRWQRQQWPRRQIGRHASLCLETPPESGRIVHIAMVTLCWQRAGVHERSLTAATFW